MTILSLVTIPSKILNLKSEEVSEVNDEIRQFINDMLETMYHENGLGLAAVQVGVLKRIMVIDVREREEVNHNTAPYIFINPEIIWESDSCVTYDEGCLSIPGIYPKISRPERILVKYLDYNGDKQELEAGGWLCRAIQHEYDHLEGILNIMRLSKIKRDLLLKKIQRISDTNNK